MKSKDVKSLNPADLGEKVGDLRKKLYGLRVQGLTEKIEDNSQIAKTRHDIARLLTERRARQIADGPGGAAPAAAKPVASKKSGAGAASKAVSGVKRGAKAKV